MSRRDERRDSIEERGKKHERLKTKEYWQNKERGTKSKCNLLMTI